LFDADGYNSLHKKNIDLSLIDYHFLYELKLQLLRCGLVTKLTKRRAKPHGVNNRMNYKLAAVGKRALIELENCGSVKLVRGNLYGKYDRLKTPYVHSGQFISDIAYEKATSTKCDMYIQKILNIEVIAR
jgi:hypothetical protein